MYITWGKFDIIISLKIKIDTTIFYTKQNNDKTFTTLGYCTYENI